MDDHERENVLANVLANRTDNYTRGLLLRLSKKRCWLEEEDAILNLHKSYSHGTGTPQTDEEKESEGEIMLQNYDLAYNLATYVLVSSESRSLSMVVRAKELVVSRLVTKLTHPKSDLNSKSKFCLSQAFSPDLET